MPKWQGIKRNSLKGMKRNAPKFGLEKKEIIILYEGASAYIFYKKKKKKKKKKIYFILKF